MFSQQKQKRISRPSGRTCVGDARPVKKAPTKGPVANRGFTALSLSDSEEEEKKKTVGTATAAVPIMLTLDADGGDWGDMMMEEEGLKRARHVPATIYYAAAEPRGKCSTVVPEEEDEDASPEWEPMEQKLWAQPFAAKLGEHTTDVFDTAGLTDAEYDAFMTFLYAEGWSVTMEERAAVRAYTDSLPPRMWVPPAEKHCHGHGHHQQKKKAATVVPRFCVKCDPAAPAEGCRYVHADTMPRVDKPCSFGEGCSKRAACLFMHPGETWTADLVISRPAVAAAAVAPE